MFSIRFFFKITLLVLIIFAFFSCNTREVFSSEEDFYKYLGDANNGYVQSKIVKGIKFTLSYRPTDALVKQEARSKISISKLDSLRHKYNRFLYFNLSVSKNNEELLSAVPKDINEFGQLAKKLSFSMNDYVNLYTQSKDTLSLIDYAYPRMFGATQETTMLLVFNKANKIKTTPVLNFTIEDLGLKTGEVKFKINSKKIINEPQLDFNQ